MSTLQQIRLLGISLSVIVMTFVVIVAFSTQSNPTQPKLRSIVKNESGQIETDLFAQVNNDVRKLNLPRGSRNSPCVKQTLAAKVGNFLDSLLSVRSVQAQSDSCGGSYAVATQMKCQGACTENWNSWGSDSNNASACAGWQSGATECCGASGGSSGCTKSGCGTGGGGGGIGCNIDYWDCWFNN